MKHLFLAVIFDFDYTLADSSKGATECINFALNALNLPTISHEVACQTIGMSLADTFLRLAGPERRAQSTEFARLFKERADEVMADMTFLYPSVPSVTRQLKQNGISLGIVSTKFRYRIASILQREDLLDAFNVIIGGEDVSTHKPHPEGLKMAIERLGVSTQHALYVGDSVIDAETAKCGDIPFTAVLSGVTQRNEFDPYAPCKLLDNLHQLVDWLLT